MTVTVLPPKLAPPGALDVTSRSTTWARAFSPFLLGPVPINGTTARRVENAWQYSKVYPEHVDADGLPTQDYLRWRDAGYARDRAERYPMGKGAVPLFAWLNDTAFSYIRARSCLYMPMYAWAVRQTPEWSKLRALYAQEKQLTLVDFDAYDHRRLGFNWPQVVLCESRKKGLGFVLAMKLEGVYAD